MRSIDETIHDLKVLQEYFVSNSNGCIPCCLPDSVEYLEELKILKGEEE